jgi:monothiol glutaredoxin
VQRSLPRYQIFAHRRLISQESRVQIQSAIDSKPVVVFMKGNPQLPECGFSRAVVHVLAYHNVPHEKMGTYDILQDSALRSDVKEFS